MNLKERTPAGPSAAARSGLAKAIVACLGLFAAAPGPVLAEKGVDNEVRGAMHEAFDALVFLIEAAIDPGAAPRPETEVEAALAKLELASGDIQQHGQLKPESFNLLGRSLEESTGRMIESYRVGLSDVADLYLLDTVEHCVTCHSLLPDNRNRAIGARFAGVVRSSEVEPALAARLLIAVRQAPLALTTWEDYLLGEEFEIASLEARAEIEDYLWQVLHLTRDPQRPRALLTGIQESVDAPFHLRRKAALWAGQLQDLAGNFEGRAGIEEIRNLFAGSLLYSDVLAGRDYLVRDALVSSQAHSLLAGATILQPEERAELYFILAMVHLRSRLLVGAVPTAELYLEAAIREAPDSEIARSAYAELQEYALQYFGEAEPSTDLFPVPMSELRRLAGVPHPEEAMTMKTRRILVAVDNSPAALARVESAINLANIIEADVTAILALHLEVPPVAASTMHGGWYVGEEILENSRQEALQSAKMIHEACDLLAERFQWDLGWIQKEGDAVHVISQEARYHDLLVLGRPDSDGVAGGFRGNVHAILLEAGVPCLVMPDASPGLAQQPARIVLAWDGGREACQAMRGALGFLVRAAEVIVLSLVAHDEERNHYETINRYAAEFLKSHGANARGMVVDKEGLFNGPSLIQQAEKLSPDMIVMGAYGHSRFRETFLGGATRHLLQQATVPVLFAH